MHIYWIHTAELQLQYWLVEAVAKVFGPFGVPCKIEAVAFELEGSLAIAESEAESGPGGAACWPVGAKEDSETWPEPKSG